MSTEEATTNEVWVYGGLHLDRKGTRYNLWIDPTGHELLYAVKGGPFVVGGKYSVEVIRTEDNVTLYVPKHSDYSGQLVDREQKLELEIADRAAKTRYEVIRHHKSDSTRSQLDATLTPLCKAASKLRTQAEIDALVAYVSRTIISAWRAGRYDDHKGITPWEK